MLRVTTEPQLLIRVVVYGGRRNWSGGDHQSSNSVEELELKVDEAIDRCNVSTISRTCDRPEIAICLRGWNNVEKLSGHCIPTLDHLFFEANINASIGG